MSYDGPKKLHYIRHRTSEEIRTANDASVNELKHMASDESRVKNPKWLVVVGVCL